MQNLNWNHSWHEFSWDGMRQFSLRKTSIITFSVARIFVEIIYHGWFWRKSDLWDSLEQIDCNTALSVQFTKTLVSTFLAFQFIKMARLKKYVGVRSSKLVFHIWTPTTCLDCHFKGLHYNPDSIKHLVHSIQPWTCLVITLTRPWHFVIEGQVKNGEFLFKSKRKNGQKGIYCSFWSSRQK